MAIRAEDMKLSGLKLITSDKYQDQRGFFSETFSVRDFAAIGLAESFVQDNHSMSVTPGTIRGLHFQVPPHTQGKLVRVARGSILDVAVDIRRGSSTYGQHTAIEISAENWRQLWIPPGFAHGFCTLEPKTEVIYKVTGYYAPECERSLRWNDPDLAIAWPSFAGSVIAAKDAAAPLFGALASPFAWKA